MEEDWERAGAHAALEMEGARDLLATLGYTPLNLTLITEGKVNTNFRVETDDGPILLRLHQGADHVFDIEASLADRLHDLLPVPALLGRGPRFLVYEWRPGVSLARALVAKADLPYDQIARSLAAVRKAMGAIPFPTAGFLASDLSVADPWPSAIEGLWSYLRSLLDKVDLPRLTAIVEDAEPRLQAIAGPPVLVHGDFKGSNLLVDETGLTAVLDWEFAHAGTYLSDVGQLLRHPETLPDGFAAAFLDEMGMDEDEALLARTLDLVNLVDFLRKERNQPRLRADVERRIDEVCGRYERRFASASGG